MIRALLLRCDAGEPPGTRLYAPRALAWLGEVRLPPIADTALRRLLRLDEAVHADAVDADQEVRGRAAADPIATQLATIHGLGPVFALTIRAEIGDIRRFAGGPALASYAGVVPRVEQSGEHRFTGAITRQGSPWLRWALVQTGIHAMKRTDRTVAPIHQPFAVDLRLPTRIKRPVSR